MRTTSVDLEQRHFDIAENMAENGDVDSQSEAIRNAIDHYAADQGYHNNGEKHQTTLRRTIRRAGDALGLTAVLWLGLTFYYPLIYRGFAIPLLLTALTFHGLDRVLASHEPAITTKLTTLLTPGGTNK